MHGHLYLQVHRPVLLSVHSSVVSKALSSTTILRWFQRIAFSEMHVPGLLQSLYNLPFVNSWPLLPLLLCFMPSQQCYRQPVFCCNLQSLCLMHTGKP